MPALLPRAARVVQYSLEVSQGHLKGKKVKEADIDNYVSNEGGGREEGGMDAYVDDVFVFLGRWTQKKMIFLRCKKLKEWKLLER